MARQPLEQQTEWRLDEVLRWKAENLIENDHGLRDRLFEILLRTAFDAHNRRLSDPSGIVTAEQGILLRPSVSEALGYLGESQAIELFEYADLELLAKREMAVGYLTFAPFHRPSFTPFVSVDALASRMAAFIEHLVWNRESLLETGFPRTAFHSFPWLDWHLGRLCFTSFPIEVRATKMHDGSVAFDYVWARRAVGSTHIPGRPVGLRNLFRFSWWGPLEINPKLPFPLRSGETWDARRFTEGIQERNERLGTDCLPSEAQLLPGLSAEDAARLARLRGGVLDLKLGALRLSVASLLQGSSEGLWSKALALIDEKLSADDAEFLLRMDHALLGFDGLHGVSAEKSPSFVPGGFTNILHVLGHVEAELSVGALHRTRAHLDTIVPMADIESVYQSIGKPWESSFRDAVDNFLVLDSAQDAFLEEFRSRVNKTIPDELHDTATITKRIKRKNKCDYERVVDTYAEWIRTQTEILGEVILGGVTQSATKEQQEVFYQRPDSQWDVSFMGTKQILDHEPGFYCLAHLLGNPGERCPMSRIRGFTTASDEIPEGLYLQRDYLDESISPSKVAKVRRNLKELEALRDEAKGDHERLTQLKEDIQRTKKYLSSVLDIHGKPRRLYDRKERDRVRLHRAIDSAREAIGRKLPLLEVHLRLCIPKIGLSPAYYPNRDPNLDKPLVWILEKR